MAVYKVIQDIESEDKLVGPLTLKSFVYAAIAGVSLFLEFRFLVANSLGSVRWILMLAFLPPMALFGVLASPLGREQPTEVWLLSHIKFFFKPHTRIWDQSGINQLVTITAPKKIARQLTKNLSQTEVRSRLQALAGTLDSRGWAVKNVAVDIGAAPGYLEGEQADSDRLIGASSLTQDIPVVDVRAADDILDEQNNPTAQKFATLMQQADDNRKNAITDKIDAARAGGATVQPGVDSTFLDQQAANGQTGTTTFVGKNIVAPGSSTGNDKSGSNLTDEERQLLDRLHHEEAELESKLPKHFGTEPGPSPRQPTAPKDRAAPTTQKPANNTQMQQVTPEVQAAKLELAQSGNDLSVASIAHLANRNNQVQQVSTNEFVVALH
jgi:hypothetical protein